ncbi:hypothetical protein FAIPA1_50180 [Frankia sp. AiPs1]
MGLGVRRGVGGRLGVRALAGGPQGAVVRAERDVAAAGGDAGHAAGDAGQVSTTGPPAGCAA